MQRKRKFYGNLSTLAEMSSSEEKSCAIRPNVCVFSSFLRLPMCKVHSVTSLHTNDYVICMLPSFYTRTCRKCSNRTWHACVTIACVCVFVCMQKRTFDFCSCGIFAVAAILNLSCWWRQLSWVIHIMTLPFSYYT